MHTYTYHSSKLDSMASLDDPREPPAPHFDPILLLLRCAFCTLIQSLPIAGLNNNNINNNNHIKAMHLVEEIWQNKNVNSSITSSKGWIANRSSTSNTTMIHIFHSPIKVLHGNLKLIHSFHWEGGYKGYFLHTLPFTGQCFLISSHYRHIFTIQIRQGSPLIKMPKYKLLVQAKAKACKLFDKPSNLSESNEMNAFKTGVNLVWHNTYQSIKLLQNAKFSQNICIVVSITHYRTQTEWTSQKNFDPQSQAAHPVQTEIFFESDQN